MAKQQIVATVQVENLEISYILDDETENTIGFVSRNLVIQATFVEFQDDHNFTFF